MNLTRQILTAAVLVFMAVRADAVLIDFKALADGSRGDRIRVKNLNSGRVVTGTVTGNGVIQVPN